VLGPAVPDLATAPVSARAAVAGLAVAAAWPAAPRPVPADALLPERALGGDRDAREALVNLYRTVDEADPTLTLTLSAFVECGGSLESTARALFVHPNTVRYRLRRVSDVTGFVASAPRDRWALSLALSFGRLDAPAPGDRSL
jgi:DNA-binding PucR family transcriptional regulator